MSECCSDNTELTQTLRGKVPLAQFNASDKDIVDLVVRSASSTFVEKVWMLITRAEEESETVFNDRRHISTETPGRNRDIDDASEAVGTGC